MRFVPIVATGALGAGLFALAQQPAKDSVIAGFQTTLVGRTANQRHNAELAVRALNGAIIGPGETFSFNKRVGTFSRDQGYRRAPVSYNGTLIQSWGGGVCQTSTTLYNAALLGGLDIIERNRHRFAPGYVAPGRDAAVAFNSIDLKLRNPGKTSLLIQANIADNQLRVSLIGETRPASEVVTEIRRAEAASPMHVSTGRGQGVRNLGKAGFEVATFRVHKGRRELISVDHYPSMAKISEN